MVESRYDILTFNKVAIDVWDILPDVCQVLHFDSHFSFCYPYVEKVLLWGQIFEVKILMDLYFLRYPESENLTFNGSSASMSVCLLSP